MEKSQNTDNEIRRKIDSLDEIPIPNMDLNKNRVWAEIEEKLDAKKTVPLYWKYSAIAAILMLFLLSSIFVSLYLAKNHENKSQIKYIIIAKNEANPSISAQKKETKLAYQNPKPIYISKIEYKEKIVKDTVKVVEYVYKTDTVKIFAEKEKTIIADVSNSIPINKQYVHYSEPTKQVEKRKFRFPFKFGNNQPSFSPNNSDNAIAFKISL